MSTSSHLESATDVGAILEKLRETRKELDVADSEAAARVATLNFITFIDDPGHRDWVLLRAGRVADKHPSRLIVLDSTIAASGVDVTTVRRESNGATVVTERVDIGVSKIDHRSIISLVQELSVPEIPTVLWWSGSRLMQSRTFLGLAQMSAAVLVDSSGKVEGEEIIRELAEFDCRYPNIVLADLAFLRLHPWQEMIAELFDNPQFQEDLFSISNLEIASGSQAEALYLAGWFGSRLSWTVSGRDTFRDVRGVTIPFQRIDRGDRRRVQSIVVTVHDGTRYHAAVHDDDSAIVELWAEGRKASRPRLVPLQNIDNTSLIEKAILSSAHDQLFETSLHTVREVLE